LNSKAIYACSPFGGWFSYLKLFSLTHFASTQDEQQVCFMATVSERVKTRNGATPEHAGAAQSKADKGGAGGERPYPRDLRCELCGSLPKKERSLIWDSEPEKRGNVTTENRRVWLCFHCKHLVGVVQTIGLKKLVPYLIPEFWLGGTRRQESERESLSRYLRDNL